MRHKPNDRLPSRHFTTHRTSMGRYCETARSKGVSDWTPHSHFPRYADPKARGAMMSSKSYAHLKINFSAFMSKA